MNESDQYSGGCQCGAVRFHVSGKLEDVSLCHCRMCQKAFGAYYAPLVTLRGAELTWTRGAPARFQSSNLARRGFCSRCGTPLTYEAEGEIAVAAGAFDQPERLPPMLQYGIGSKLPFVDALHRLPEHRLEEDAAARDFLVHVVSFQHPDHDTDDWSPRRA